MALSEPSVKKLPQSEISFPPAWLWLVDELVPSYVKAHYSPRDSWKDKPFAPEDVRFFSKGVLELSELFTSDRPIGASAKMPSYFLHPKFRSAYLLYFLQLQMAKFITLFERHPDAVDAALVHGRKRGYLTIADLGAGPGTASIALLLVLLARKGEIPPVHLIWFDTNRSIMEDGKRLAEAFSDQFPRLRGKLEIQLHAEPWWGAPRVLSEPCSLIILGHVLNEARQIPGALPRSMHHDDHDSEHPLESRIHPIWSELLQFMGGGGILMVEPASKGASQNLSRLRDQILAAEVIPSTASSIWGPCLHADACPLAQGRDWCHFSVPIRVPGKWFRMFSEALSSERQWLKFSYLWLASRAYPGPIHDSRLRRVLSDPMSASKDRGEVLICEPIRPGRVNSPVRDPLWRGDLIQLRTPQRKR